MAVDTPEKLYRRIRELEQEARRLRQALIDIRDGLFRYNMGDYEACARNCARLALGEEGKS